MGNSNLLYLLLLYAVLDKEGKLGTTTGLLIAVGVMVCAGCLNNDGNCRCRRQSLPPQPYQPYNTYYNDFLYNNALT